jgi:hypothetical protein
MRGKTTTSARIVSPRSDTSTTGSRRKRDVERARRRDPRLSRARLADHDPRIVDHDPRIADREPGIAGRTGIADRPGVAGRRPGRTTVIWSECDLERTPDGVRIAVSRVIDAPEETVWRLFVDTRRWPEWGPSVAAVECTDRVIREGSTGRVRVARVGLWVPFVVETCADRRWTWRVAGVRATGHRVEPLGVNRCRATFEVPLFAAAYVPVCRRALGYLDASAAGGTE